MPPLVRHRCLSNLAVSDAAAPSMWNPISPFSLGAGVEHGVAALGGGVRGWSGHSDSLAATVAACRATNKRAAEQA